VLKARIYEELKAPNHVTISQAVTQFSWQNGMFEKRLKSWHDFLNRDAILRRIWNTN